MLNIFLHAIPLGLKSQGSSAKLQSALLQASGCWQSPVAVGLVVWRSQGLHHTTVCSADGLPNLFLFISNTIEFVVFYPLKCKALDNVPHETDTPTLLLSKNEYRPHACLKLYII